MRGWVYSVMAVVVVGAVLLGLVLDGAGHGFLWLGAAALLAAAVWLYRADLQEDELFADDWAEMAQIAAAVGCAIGGVGMLVAAVAG